MDLEDRVQVLEDQEELEKLRYEYARRIDDREWGRWPELFTEDATCSFEGWGTYEGRDELEAFMRDEVAAAFEYTAHVMHHPVITVDGDTASGEWYTEIYYALADENVAGWRQGRYSDSYRRVDGTWKFESVSHRFFARNLVEYSRTEDEEYGTLVDYGAPVDAP